ncbi:unnamed protein product, partial [Rotaria sordida]
SISTLQYGTIQRRTKP